MKHTTTISLVMLACATMLASWDVSAQGRTPAARSAREPAKAEVNPNARAAKRAELDAWLRRLVGKFRLVVTPPMEQGIHSPCDVEAADRPAFAISCTPSRDVRPPTVVMPQYGGSAECRGIEPGPGVSCVLEFDDPRSQLPAAGPKVILFGLDPDEPGIRLMEVLHVASATFAGRGSLKGDAVSFNLECVKQWAIGSAENPWATCKRSEQIRARADGKRIEMSTGEIWTAKSGQAVINNSDMQIVLLRVAEEGE